MIRVDTKSLIDESLKCLSNNSDKCLAENQEIISEMIIHLDLLNYWANQIIPNPTNIILQEVNYDLLSSIQIGAMGMYRNAFISLRSALELGLSFFYFSDNNYDFLLWKKNEFDMKWAILEDPEKGVLTEKYIHLFVNDFLVENIVNVVEEVYRECSEYVHGKYDFMHTIKGQSIKYNKEKFLNLSRTFLKITEILNIYLSIRFNEKIDQSFANDKLNKLQDILDEFDLLEVLSYGTKQCRIHYSYRGY